MAQVEILRHPTDEDWQRCKLLALNTIGRRNFEYEHDMGASIPTCKLGKDMHGPCSSFEANSLYLKYAESIKERAEKSKKEEAK